MAASVVAPVFTVFPRGKSLRRDRRGSRCESAVAQLLVVCHKNIVGSIYKNRVVGVYLVMRNE